MNPPIHDRLESSIVYADVHDERNRAHKKHGPKGNSREDQPWNEQEWLPILVEEVGEVAHELTYDTGRTTVDRAERMREELVQVAAMACAWIAAIDEYLVRAIREVPE